MTNTMTAEELREMAVKQVLWNGGNHDTCDFEACVRAELAEIQRQREEAGHG